jgi:hypothetical protein
VLPQHADDLFFREPALPHESLPGYFLPQSIPTKNGQLFRGQCTCVTPTCCTFVVG